MPYFFFSVSVIDRYMPRTSQPRASPRPSSASPRRSSASPRRPSASPRPSKYLLVKPPNNAGKHLLYKPEALNFVEYHKYVNRHSKGMETELKASTDRIRESAKKARVTREAREASRASRTSLSLLQSLLRKGSRNRVAPAPTVPMVPMGGNHKKPVRKTLKNKAIIKKPNAMTKTRAKAKAHVKR